MGTQKNKKKRIKRTQNKGRGFLEFFGFSKKKPVNIPLGRVAQEKADVERIIYLQNKKRSDSLSAEEKNELQKYETERAAYETMNRKKREGQRMKSRKKCQQYPKE